MAKLSELFSNLAPPYPHPLVRFIDSADPEKPTVEVVRPRDILGFKPASIFFYWSRGGVVQPPQQYTWDPQLNAELIKRHIASIDEDAETVRFGLAFKEAFRRAEIRFGDGFFNGVLIMIVKELGFAQEDEVADVLKDITPGNPSMRGESFADCKTLISDIVRKQANDLSSELNYAEDRASRILARAVAYYLDERFSVTNRRRLGF